MNLGKQCETVRRMGINALKAYQEHLAVRREMERVNQAEMDTVIIVKTKTGDKEIKLGDLAVTLCIADKSLKLCLCKVYYTDMQSYPSLDSTAICVPFLAGVFPEEISLFPVGSDLRKYISYKALEARGFTIDQPFVDEMLNTKKLEDAKVRDAKKLKQ